MTMTVANNITIESLGARGDGIGRLPDGRRVFVLGALPGETVSVALGDSRDDGVTGYLVDVARISPGRVMPACGHFGLCGGCVLQHMDETYYRDFKLDQVRQALARNGLHIGAIDGPHVSPPGSRRRAVMASYCGPDRLVLGFNEPRSNKIADQAECPILHPALQKLVPPLRRVLGGILQPGQGMDIAMMESGGAVDMVMRPWVKVKKDKDHLPRYMAGRLAAFAEEAGLARLSWQNVAADDTDLMPVAWRYAFTVNFSGTIVTPPPGAFLQATEAGEKRLVACVLAGLTKKTKKVADLYAGCGTFTFAMAGAKIKVHAVEGFAPALNALKTAMPGRPVSAERRDLAKEPLSSRELNGYDAVVLDPPRVGAASQARMLAKSSVPVVIYVSCSAKSFAADAGVLKQGGYELEKLSVIDQFLWSPHVELVGVFRRG
jgi:23S rRNA (uracil1939-C5)-methyltransferase